MTTPTLEQKIEAEFEKWWTSEGYKLNPNSYEVELEDCLNSFKAAALPLYKEIKELEEALDLSTFTALKNIERADSRSDQEMHDINHDKYLMEYMRDQFNLDKAQP